MNLLSKSVKELKNICKQYKLKSYSHLTKDSLIELIQKHIQKEGTPLIMKKEYTISIDY